MKVFVAGAAGAIGRRLIPLLVANGHEVVASTRQMNNARLLGDLGATPVIADGLDRDSLVSAVIAAEPEVVVHQMTALADVTDYRNWDEAFAVTNRLRTEGTDHLVEGARATGARRVVAQSFGNWNYERRGGPVKTEADPLDPDPPPTMRQTLEAIRHLETVVTRNAAFEGIALRYANLYGPHTGFAPTATSPRCASGGCRSSAAAAACGRSCTSTTPRRPRWRRSSTATPASTTSPTTSPPARGPGCRARRGGWAPSHRAACPPGGASPRGGRRPMFTEIRGADNDKAKREL